ncbi:MAG: DUF5320 domain-containing protein [Oscillospiraceae bacterium]|nr:DUF5320 domain-containing protein [Oscillospiraceae bacterium]
MPKGDKTGPDGRGPMTGRGTGYCAGFPVPGFQNPGVRGCGRGRGFERGFGKGFGVRGSGYRGVNSGYGYDPIPVQEIDEKSALKSQADYLMTSLEKVNQRLKDLDDDQK